MLNAALAIGVLLIVLVGLHAKLRVPQLSQAQACRDAFYEAAGVLVEHERTPTSVLDLIKFLSDNLANPKLARMVFFDLLLGRVRERWDNPPPEAATLLNDLRSLPKPLAEKAAFAAASFGLGITYNNPVFGALLRRLVLYAVQRSKGDGNIPDTEPLIIDIATSHGLRPNAA